MIAPSGRSVNPFAHQLAVKPYVCKTPVGGARSDPLDTAPNERDNRFRARKCHRAGLPGEGRGRSRRPPREPPRTSKARCRCRPLPGGAGRCRTSRPRLKAVAPGRGAVASSCHPEPVATRAPKSRVSVDLAVAGSTVLPEVNGERHHRLVRGAMHGGRRSLGPGKGLFVVATQCSILGKPECAAQELPIRRDQPVSGDELLKWRAPAYPLGTAPCPSCSRTHAG